MRYILCLIIGLLTFVVTFGQVTEDDLRNVDQLLSSYNGDRPGCVVSIIHKQKVIYEKGFGKANLQDNIAFTPKTPYYIASMTKQFIAAGIGILAIQEKLNLNDNIYKYLPELSQYKKSISIRNLLNHTSGIRDYSNLMFMRGDSNDGFISLTKAIDILSKQSALNFEPGEKHLYSNSNYVLLAEIISRVSKTDFRVFMQQEIFHPLGMEHTRFTDSKSNQSKGQVQGYFINKKGEYESVMNHLPVTQDQIITTIKDFYLWDQNFITKTVGGEKLQNMILQNGKLSNGQVVNYSFGLNLENYRGFKTITHGGYLRGFKSNYIQLPEANLSIIIFANSSDINVSDLTNEIIKILLGDKLKVEKSKALPDVLPAIKISNEELIKYCGSYWYKEYEKTREIYINNDTLRYKNPSLYERVLLPVGKDQFRRLDVDKNEQTAHIKFNFDGGSKRMIIDSNISDSLIMEAYEVPHYSRSLFKSIEGTYYCKDLDIKYELKKKKGLIRVILKEKIQSRLVIRKKDHFVDYHFGTYKFVRDEFSKIKGFYLSIERSKNLYFHKISN